MTRYCVIEVVNKPYTRLQTPELQARLRQTPESIHIKYIIYDNICITILAELLEKAMEREREREIEIYVYIK